MSEFAAPSTSYEEVPYQSIPFTVTHPDGMAVVATLLGMTPAKADRCRVLELGCAGGGNLIPLAVSLPNSQFVGIDLSPSQIAEGQAEVDALSLTNIQLQALDIMDLRLGLGQFDYIICHGVYSWVPAEVQDKILTICKDHLAPNGVSYVSYNVYPGWHMWSVLSDMISFHAGHFTGAQARLKAVRGFLGLVERGVQDAPDLYSRVLAAEVAHLSKQPDAYLFHEHLEENNTPVFFREFVQKAHVKGLQYLEEAHCHCPANIAPDVLNTVMTWPVNLIHREQYIDFLGGRSFRRTLLCHEEIVLSRPLAPEAVMHMHLVAAARPEVANPDILATEPLEFRAEEVFATTNPLVKAALVALWELRPRFVPLAQLWQEVRTRLHAAPPAVQSLLEAGPRALAKVVLYCYLNLYVDLHLHVPDHVLEPGVRPLASPLARLQAKSTSQVTNLMHQSIAVNGLDRAVLGLLDGTCDRPTLVRELADLALQGTLAIHADGAPLQDRGQIQTLLEATLPASLRRLGELALLLK